MEEYPLVPEFLKIRLKIVDHTPSFLGLCAGYESEDWRSDQLAHYAIQHIPQFSLPVEEWNNFNSATGLSMISSAAKTIYRTDKYHNRGEIGEILLFAILRRYFDTLPVISKIFFKSSANDTVKGFDGIHFSYVDEKLLLWLGEVKFYTKYSSAVRDVLLELEDHLKTDFLREEFMWTSNKLSDGHPDFSNLSTVIDSSNSLDEIIDSINIPILITYRSNAIKKHKKSNDAYKKAISDEFQKRLAHFTEKCPSVPVNIHLILIPLERKVQLVRSFDERLRALGGL